MATDRGTHHVRKGDAGLVLVEHLARKARAGTRAMQEAAHLVRAGRVQINGNICLDPAQELKAGDVVKILPHAIARAATAEDVRLVHVDEHVVVVEKPPGVTSQREQGEGGAARSKRSGRQKTLDEMLARLLSERSGTAKAPGEAGRGARGRDGPHHRAARRRAAVFPVHRLDRDTSGLMLFARTPEAERALTGQFKARAIERSYLAVVHGHPGDATITSHIVRDRGDGLRGSAELWGRDPAAGQRAVTHVETLERIGPYAVVRCTLETGRTHQIRIHLAEIGHMLCGEKQYTRLPDGTRVRDQSRAPRQALHAQRLAFVHPASGKTLRFSSRLPPDLSRWLEELGGRYEAGTRR